MTWFKSLLARRILKQHSPDRGLRLEWAIALTLWVYLFLLIVTLVIGRSVGSALFLDRFDGRGLATLYILQGLVVAALVGALEWIGRNHSTHKVAFCTLLSVLVLSAGTAVLLPRLPSGEHPYLYGLLYLLVESLAFVTTVQFWATANSALSLDQARRLYVFIGTGGIFGSIAGGTITRLMAHGPASRMFELIAAILPVQLLAILAFGLLARRQSQRSPKQADQWNIDRAAPSVALSLPTTSSAGVMTNPSAPPTHPSSFILHPSASGGVMSSPSAPPMATPKLAICFGLVSLLMVFSTTLVDYYYKMFADTKYSGDVHQLTAFFGGFYLSVGLATLVTQVILTPLVIRRGSAFAGLWTSPAALVALTALNLAWPGIWMAAAFKLTDSVLTHSVYRSCQEMLYTPLPTRWARRFKSLSDGVFGRYGLLLSGLFLVVMAPRLDRYGPNWLLPWTLLALAAWGYSVALLKREYRLQAEGGDAPAVEPRRLPIPAFDIAAEEMKERTAA